MNVLARPAEFTCGKRRVALNVTAKRRSRSVEFYRLSKEGKEHYVSKLSLVDAVDPYTLTSADFELETSHKPLIN